MRAIRLSIHPQRLRASRAGVTRPRMPRGKIALHGTQTLWRAASTYPPSFPAPTRPPSLALGQKLAGPGAVTDPGAREDGRLAQADRTPTAPVAGTLLGRISTGSLVKRELVQTAKSFLAERQFSNLLVYNASL